MILNNISKQGFHFSYTTCVHTLDDQYSKLFYLSYSFLADFIALYFQILKTSL